MRITPETDQLDRAHAANVAALIEAQREPMDEEAVEVILKLTRHHLDTAKLMRAAVEVWS